MDKKELINKLHSYSNFSVWKRIFSWSLILDNLIDNIIKLEEKDVDELNNKIYKLEIDNKMSEEFLKEANNKLSSLEKDLIKKDAKISSYENNLKDNEVSLSSKISEIKNLSKSLGEIETEKKELNKQFIKYIEKNGKETSELLNIFNKSPATKGKLGEIRLEEIIKNSIEDERLYTKNLKVEKGNVEFGIKTTLESIKWVPVDSKVVEPDKTANGEWIIDDKYALNVEKRAKEIATKYVNKRVTESYGILVIQNDFIYDELIRNTNILDRLINLNVYLSSPNNFLQFIKTIDKLSGDLKLVNEITKFKLDIGKIIKPINYFYKNVKDSVDKLNIAFNTHLLDIDNNVKIIEKDILKIEGMKKLPKNEENIIDVESE